MDRVALAEAAERELMLRLDEIGARVRDRMGIAVRRLGGGVVRVRRPGRPDGRDACLGQRRRGGHRARRLGRRPAVATGVLFVDGEAGELVSGATRPRYRGRGAQSALVARRVRDGLAAGCRWFLSETGKPAPGEHNPSLDNLRRAGFEVIYDRPIWTWKA